MMEATQICELFRILGDPTRLSILLMLMDGERCVTDVAASLGMSKCAISHQLRTQKGNHLIRRRKAGKFVFYSLSDGYIQEIIEKAQEHLAKV